MQRLTAQEAMAHPYLKPIKVQREEAEAAQKQQQSSGAINAAQGGGTPMGAAAQGVGAQVSNSQGVENLQTGSGTPVGQEQCKHVKNAPNTACIYLVIFIK